jgi:hypothetical protein
VRNEEVLLRIEEERNILKRKRLKGFVTSYMGTAF